MDGRTYSRLVCTMCAVADPGLANGGGVGKVERRPKIFFWRGYAPSPEKFFDVESQIVEF